MKRYYSLYQNKENKSADIYIYGDITSWEWEESDVSSYTLSKELQVLESTDNINVYINSYGGEVKEGLAIYNALKRHKAKITTIADGFACSIASVIFAAGDERLMSDTSFLMIHDAWSIVSGNPEELRKQADDLEKITQASVNAYMKILDVDEEELKDMMSTDTWIDGNEALEMGFATELLEVDEKQVATQSVRNKLMQRVTKEPEKVAVAEVKIDEEQMEEIVQKGINKFKEETFITDFHGVETGSLKNLEKQQNKNKENKPINMMRALFNLEEE